MVRRVLAAFPAPDTAAFFREIGVPLHEESDGKLFPDSNRARDVLDALLREATRVGVRLLAGHRVAAITRTDRGFDLATSRGRFLAGRVVLATGGLSLPKTGSDGAGLAFAKALGHTIVPLTPGLTPLLLAGDDALHRRLTGVSQDVVLTVRAPGSRPVRLAGAMLWTHFGVSGPVALNASRHWLRAALAGTPATVTMNVASGAAFDAVDEQWRALARDRPKAAVRSALSGMTRASFADALLSVLGVDGAQPLAHFSRDERRRLVHALSAWALPVVGARGYNYAEVTAGGVALTEIDPATMASRVCPGLYLVGEVLDVDGRLGGFNFQWAWSSGRVAGAAVAS